MLNTYSYLQETSKNIKLNTIIYKKSNNVKKYSINHYETKKISRNTAHFALFWLFTSGHTTCH